MMAIQLAGVPGGDGVEAAVEHPHFSTTNSERIHGIAQLCIALVLRRCDAVVAQKPADQSSGHSLLPS